MGRYSTVIREGNIGAAFYVLLRGQIQCVSATKSLHVVLDAGAYFGEGALVTEVRRQATVTALEPCHLLQFSAHDVQDVASLHDGFAEVRRFSVPEHTPPTPPPPPLTPCVAAPQVRVHIIAQILGFVPYFSSLSRAQQEALAAIMEVRTLHAQRAIFSQGDPGDKLYVLIEGCVKMYREGNPEAVATYTMQMDLPVFGELALQGVARAATAVCAEPTKVLIVKSDHFQSFIEVIPHFRQVVETASSAFDRINEIKQQQLDEQSKRPVLRRFDSCMPSDYQAHPRCPA